MASVKSREIRLRERPEGMPTEANFELAETELPPPEEGEFLVRNIWMSVDPYMRIRMNAERSYAPPFEVGKPLTGRCVGEVIQSKHGQYSEGDYVISMNGWREYWLSDGKGVSTVDPELAPLEGYLGPFGMTGMTAYIGMMEIGQLRQGDRVFVSAASGAVGSVACQIAKIHGCQVVGTAGSDEKLDWLKSELGLDGALNYKQIGDLAGALEQEMPEGIDLYYDNVGSDHLEAALVNMNDFGRIVACGMISLYNVVSPPPGPPSLFMTITKRLRMQGFIVGDHTDKTDAFLVDMKRWYDEGRIKWRDTVIEGIENAPRAFLGLFQGENVGKMLVKIGPAP